MARDFAGVAMSPEQLSQVMGMAPDTIAVIIAAYEIEPTEETGNARTYSLFEVVKAAIHRHDKVKSADVRNEAQAKLIDVQRLKLEENWGNIDEALSKMVPIFQAIQTEIQRSDLSEEAKSDITELIRGVFDTDETKD